MFHIKETKKINRFLKLKGQFIFFVRMLCNMLHCMRV